MNLVYEQHVSLFQRGKQTGQITRLVQHRSRSEFHINPEFIGYDMGEGCLSKSRRPVEEHVIKGLPSHFGRLYEYLEVGYYLLLTGELGEVLWPYNSVQFIIFAGIDVVWVELFLHRNIIINTNII